MDDMVGAIANNAVEGFANEKRKTVMNDIYEELDKGIAPIVTILRMEGVNTFSSCEGGEGHCFQWPTIRITPPNPDDMRQEINKIAAILARHGYTGYYIKAVHAYQDKPIPWQPKAMSFIEIELWQMSKELIIATLGEDRKPAMTEEEAIEMLRPKTTPGTYA